MAVRLLRPNFKVSYHLVAEVVVIHVLAEADGDVQLDIAVQSVGLGRLTAVMGTKPRGEV